MSNVDGIPMTSTENPDGSITRVGAGRKIAGELFTPGQPMTEEQDMASVAWFDVKENDIFLEDFSLFIQAKQ